MKPRNDRELALVMRGGGIQALKHMSQAGYGIEAIGRLLGDLEVEVYEDEARLGHYTMGGLFAALEALGKIVHQESEQLLGWLKVECNTTPEKASTEADDIVGVVRRAPRRPAGGSDG